MGNKNYKSAEEKNDVVPQDEANQAGDEAVVKGDEAKPGEALEQKDDVKAEESPYVISRLDARMDYGLEPNLIIEGGGTKTLVTADQIKQLEDNKVFQLHVKNGFINYGK